MCGMPTCSAVPCSAWIRAVFGRHPSAQTVTAYVGSHDPPAVTVYDVATGRAVREDTRWGREMAEGGRRPVARPTVWT